MGCGAAQIRRRHQPILAKLPLDAEIPRRGLRPIHLIRRTGVIAVIGESAAIYCGERDSCRDGAYRIDVGVSLPGIIQATHRTDQTCRIDPRVLISRILPPVIEHRTIRVGKRRANRRAARSRRIPSQSEAWPEIQKLVMTASPARVPGITWVVPARRRELELLGCDALIEPVVIEVGDAAMLQVRHDGRIPTKAHTDCQSRSNLP